MRHDIDKSGDAVGKSIAFVLVILALSLAFYAFDTRVTAIDVQTLVRISICGNGLVEDEVEVCDDGELNNTGFYASSTSERTCAPGCERFGPYCGDGILQVRFNEQCDDGNHTNGDLCTSTCTSETPVPPGGNGSPTVGGTPQVPGAQPGTIPSIGQTRVVFRGKAYPNALVNVLLDGQIIDSTRADSRADFVYSTTAITPGTATFGFSAKDTFGTDSITTSVVFEVVQSAVTTVANVFFPPTIRVSERQVEPGALLTVSGQTIPAAKVTTEIGGGGKTLMNAIADAAGVWALQLDTKSITEGQHTAKSYFEESSTVRSGFGKSVTFIVGKEPTTGLPDPDLNDDGKVNLVDFSIFLLSWNTDNWETDFNGDGTTNLADFSIMLYSWTG